MNIFGLFLFTITLPISSYAADVENGSELHAKSCTQGHDSAAYTLEDRKVHNLARLGTQVRFCKHNLGVAWFDDVIELLKKEYYHY